MGGGNVQVVFGTYSELIREEINKALRRDIKQVLFNSPMQGRMIPLEEVPDKIFAGKIVGNGVAFLPEKGELVAPVGGKIIHVYPSLHAIGIETEHGLQVLLHIGIDTSHLQGKYFTCFVKEGDQVEPGQLLVRFNLNRVKKNSKSLATPMLITNVDKVKSWSFAPYKTVKKKARRPLCRSYSRMPSQREGTLLIEGIGASSGIAMGKAFVIPTWEWDFPDKLIDVADLAYEFERLYDGIHHSKVEIEQIKQEFVSVLGEEQTQIFDAHLAILEDPIFMSEVQGIMQRQYKAAEVAVKEAIDKFVNMFDLLDDHYMKERALDIKDVGNRLLKHLLGALEETLPPKDQPYILVAKELIPSQMVHLDVNQTMGIVTMMGGKTSHVAIMARAMSVPYVLGLEGKLQTPIQNGDYLIIDGDEGIVYVNPEEEIIRQYEARRESWKAVQEQLQKLAHLLPKPKTAGR